MPSPKGFILYRIYYGDTIIYLGRTKQSLQNRIRGHLFKKPMHRSIDINEVTKIEYADFDSEADMNVYEIYYINLYKPPLNVDDKCKDNLTVSLPEIEWKLFDTPLWEKWKKEIEKNDIAYRMRQEERTAWLEMSRIKRKQWHEGKISEEEYYDFMESRPL